MDRRRLLQYGLGSLGLAVAGKPMLVRAAGKAHRREAFADELAVPPVLASEKQADGRELIAFAAREGSREFFSGVETPTLGYDGDYLGPTIRVRQGQRVRIRFRNRLRQTTTVHWHGLHVPARWDGGPRQPVGAGASWEPEFTIRQQAATLWYHPHAMGLTGAHVYRGLAGLFLIDDEVSDSLPLPRDYGIDDIPLVVQDRRFFEDGSFAYVQSMHDIMHGVLGDILLVNGLDRPFMKVPRGLVRFRILNGSNSSIYKLRFSDARQFFVIGSDGGLLSRPVTAAEAIMTAGERLELLVDFSDLGTGDGLRLMVDHYGGYSHEALAFIGSGRAARVNQVPESLREQSRLEASAADTSRYLAMETRSGRGMGMMGRGRLSINGRKMDLNRIDERVALGSTEIWEVENVSGMMMQVPHSLHIHDVQFNILDRNGQPPAEIEAGRKDTVLLWPGERVRLIMRFENYTGIYMYHCHMLEHEDDGMMGQFEVVDPDRISRAASRLLSPES